MGHLLANKLKNSLQKEIPHLGNILIYVESLELYETII